MQRLRNEAFSRSGAAAHAVLLLHGLGGGPYELQLLGERLHAAGLGVHAVHYPGHDVDARRMPASTWEDWYAHADAAYARLSAGGARVDVVGFSTGCLLALRLAARRPVGRLALLSPFLKVHFAWYYLLPPELYVKAFSRLLADVPRRHPPLFDRAMRAEVARVAYFKTFNLRAARSALELIALTRAELGTITTPTLILQSRRDSVVAPGGAAELAEGLKSAQVELVWLERSEHPIALDVEREGVFARVGAFLGKA